MTLKATPENSQEIADIFLDWMKSLCPAERSLAMAHDLELKNLNERRYKKANMGPQSRLVLLATLYIWYYDHVMKCKKITKYADET